MNRSQLRAILVPNAFQAAVCVVLALLILGFANWDLILINYLHIGFDQVIYGSYQAELARLGGLKLVNTAVIILFWAAIGLLAYTAFWLLVNLLIETRNQVML